MTVLPVERRTKKAVAMPAIPAPTTTTSTVGSERSGRGGSSGPSWTSHGDRFGQSAYLDAGDPGAAFHRTSVIARARTHHESIEKSLTDPDVRDNRGQVLHSHTQPRAPL